jgi:hypothetical protein
MEARHLAGQASRERDQALVILAEQLAVDARLVIEAFEVGERRELHQVAIALIARGQEHQVVRLLLAAAIVAAAARDVRLHPQDGVHAFLLAGFVELDGAEEAAVVGDGERRHAELGRAGHHGVDARGAVEQAVVGVDVEVDEIRVGIRLGSSGRPRHRALMAGGSVPAW